LLLVDVEGLTVGEQDGTDVGYIAG
jgi:hypothetical protein